MVIKVKYNGEWVKIPYLSSDHGRELVEEAPKDGKQYARQNGVLSVVNIPEVDFTDVYNAIDTKVDKVEGKGLSTNDYVTADKTKVTNINEVVEAATKNITATGISITLDKRNLVTNVVENIELNLPVSTTALAGLMLPSDKTKLNGIAAGAEVNVNADWNATEGDALILNKPTLAAVATSGSYDDLAGKPVLATVATSGSYNDLKDVPDPTLIEATDGEYSEYNVQSVLINILFSDETSITQDEYDAILSAIPVGKIACKYSYNCGLALQYGIGEFLLLRGEDEGEIYVYSYSNSSLDGSSNICGSAIIKSDLSVISGMRYTTIRPENTDITIQSTYDQKEVSISLHTGGDGTKALMDDGNYRKLPVYGRNLLLGSGKEVSNSNYNIADYWLTEPISKGTQVTLTIFGELGDDKEMFTIYNSTGAVGSMAQFSKADFVNGKASKTFKWITNIGNAVADNTHMVVFSSPKTGTSTSTIHKIKLEYGDISTEWSPAWEDIPDLEERYAYGVEWDTASSSPDGVRVGNMQLHRELPVQSKMRRCLLDRDGGVKEYLDNELSWGGSYLDYAVMTEIPEHWYKLYFNGTKFRKMLSEIPLPGYKHVDKFYISTYEARMYRTDNLLCSAAGASKLSDPNSTNFRGGDNTAEWDDTYRSLLGCPVTNLTRDQFRQAARKRGSGWEIYTYGAHKTLFWLFAVEYATLNSQKPFNAQKDANGFSQGGLGEGSTQMTDWANFNNSNPLIQCGYTSEFGNGSGEKAYVVQNASGGIHATLMANRYRSIENPFGHIWKYTDGANIQVTTGDAGLSVLWTTDDPSNFSDTSYTGYDKKGNICRTNGYAKKMLLGEDGDIVATEIGGSSSTYWCDYYYTYTSANRMQVVQVGGNAAHGPHAGLAYVSTNDAPSGVSRNVGSRLCFFPKYKSTEITTTTE
nr:MAG TPA: tail collar fiber protein [Crassvirales sp.]